MGTSHAYCYYNADRLISSTDPSVAGVAYDSHGNILYGDDVENRHLFTAPLFKTALFVVGTPSPRVLHGWLTVVVSDHAARSPAMLAG